MNTINERKELFSKYILNKVMPVDDNIVNEFYEVCHKNIESNHKYFFTFFKATYDYYENTISAHLDIFSKWFAMLNYKDIDYNNASHNYSDLDKYIILTLKINQFLLDTDYVETLINYYSSLSVITTFESDFFIKYNLCKFYYESKNLDKARLIYFDIITYKREWYIEMIPFKYRDYIIASRVIINILHAKDINHYDYNTIIKYLKECQVDTKSISYLDKSPGFQQLSDLKKIVINYLFDNKLNIRIGTLTGKSKSHAGFIKDETGSYYINPNDMQKEYKINQTFYFTTYDSFDFKKNIKATNALIIQENII